jgi:AraC-like DNA-binding protein
MAAMSCSSNALAVSAVLRAASRCLNDEHVGLRIGMAMNPANLGALGYAAMTAPNGISAVRLYEELQQLIVAEISLRHETKGPQVHVHVVGLGRLPDDYPFWSFLLAYRLNLVRGGCGRLVVPDLVTLPCAAPRCDQTLRSFVGVPVQFKASHYRECYQSSWLHEPNPQSSPEIHGVMATMARREWMATFDPQERVIARLKEAILQTLQHGAMPTLDALAPKLLQTNGSASVMTARQLQRKLATHQRSFRSLVNEVRREQALAQLRSTDRPLADIAAEAGYAELSSFHRAIRRWTGLTPMRIRHDGAGCPMG